MKEAWIVAAALMLAPRPALAADWVSIGKSANGNEAFIDASTVTSSGKTTRVWVKYDFSSPKPSGAISSTQLHEINCAAHEYRVANFADYASDGSSVRTGKGSETSEPIIPDTMAEAIHEAVCPLS